MRPYIKLFWQTVFTFIVCSNWIKQVYVQLPTYADNVALPAYRPPQATLLCAVQQSIRCIDPARQYKWTVPITWLFGRIFYKILYRFCALQVVFVWRWWKKAIRKSGIGRCFLHCINLLVSFVHGTVIGLHDSSAFYYFKKHSTPHLSKQYIIIHADCIMHLCIFSLTCMQYITVSPVCRYIWTTSLLQTQWIGCSMFCWTHSLASVISD